MQAILFYITFLKQSPVLTNTVRVLILDKQRNDEKLFLKISIRPANKYLTLFSEQLIEFARKEDRNATRPSTTKPYYTIK